MIGGGPSYFDIARRISPYVKGEILVSTNTPLLNLSSKNQRNLTKVENLLPKKRGVSFIDGAIEYDIDIILLCTAYQYDYSFLPKLQVSESGQRVCELWEQMFWIHDPTLSFVGLPKMSAVFTVAEAQSAYIARALARRLDFPSKPTMERELEEELKGYEAGAAIGAGRVATDRFHNFNYPKDKEYINRLSEESWVIDEEENLGKRPPQFGSYFDWTRKNSAAMREAFYSKRDEKHSFTSPESLGFCYTPSST